MASRDAILVTGSHRSGTTWVGKTIAASPAVVYFREPFNLDRPPEERWVPVKYWYTYVSTENEQAYAGAIRRILDWRLNPYAPLQAAGARPITARLRDRLRPIKRRLRGTRALLKDPIAIFSAPWLATRFNMRLVVMIRHPAAFASSVKLLNWKHPFSDFLNQPLLMKDLLQPFEDEIREYIETEHDVIDHAALLWKLIHYVIGKYVERHPDWIFVRHEDLSRDPLNRFQAIFDNLDLEFSPSVADYIRAQSLLPDTGDQSRLDPFTLKRNSLANISNWKTRLTPGEIERIKLQVQDISKYFYSELDW